MRYDAVAVGPLDLASGIDFLKKSENHPLAWISANILDADNAPVFAPFIVKETGQLKTGIIGLTNQRTVLPEGFHMGDWRSILPTQLSNLSKGCDKIILLSNLSKNENEEIAQHYPEINLIITADPQMTTFAPEKFNNTIITGTVQQGKYLGILDITWGNTERWESEQDRRINSLNSSLDSVNAQLSELESQKNQTAPQDQLLFLKNSRQDLLQQISALKEKKEAENPKGTIPSSFTDKSLAITSSLPENADVEKIVSEIKQKILLLNNTPQRTNESGSNASFQGVAGFSGPYAGFSQCRACHQIQENFWLSTRHARSFASLQRARQEKNLECLPCHVTAGETFSPKNSDGMKGLLSLPPPMQTVGCEVCHGPARAHAENPANSWPAKKVDRKVCLSCHTKERDPGFDYEAKVKLIQCPSQ